MQFSDTRQPFKGIWGGVGLAAILLLSLVLRLTGIDWDGYYHLHPDERYIVWVGTTIEWPENWKTAFDPVQSTFNPFYWPPDAESKGIQVSRSEPRDFAYGHWPLYLGVAAGHLLVKCSTWAERLPESWTLLRDLCNASGRIEYTHLLVVGRALSALVDTVTVWLVFLIGRRLFNPLAGLIASAFLTLSVMNIQSAHFFITDPFLSAAVAASVYWMVRRVQSRRKWPGWIAGGMVGLAVGAKFSAIMLVLPLAIAIGWKRVPPVVALGGWKHKLGRLLLWLKRFAPEFATSLVVGLIVFALTNPFALLDNTCQLSMGPYEIPFIHFKIGEMTVNSCYLENIGTQGGMVRGSSRIPFTFQYIGTQPYGYFLGQMFKWGLGAPLTIVGFCGLLWGIWQALQTWPRRSLVVVLYWALPFFLVTGSFQVKFLRYLLPLTPFLAVLGAGWLVAKWPELASKERPRRRWKISDLASPLALAVTLGLTALWAIAFVGQYRAARHPWIEASTWIYENIPSGSTLANEHWDNALPLSLTSDDWKSSSPSFKDWQARWYYVEDPLRSVENRVSLSSELEQLAGTDYVILSSNRLYGVIPKIVWRLPESAAYYRLLFSGDLGFDLVYWNGRYPTLGSLSIQDDTFAWPHLKAPDGLAEWKPTRFSLNLGPADESFTVYDHPLVMIFENRGRLGAAEMEELILQEAGR